MHIILLSFGFSLSYSRIFWALCLFSLSAFIAYIVFVVFSAGNLLGSFPVLILVLPTRNSEPDNGPCRCLDGNTRWPPSTLVLKPLRNSIRSQTNLVALLNPRAGFPFDICLASCVSLSSCTDRRHRKEAH